MIRHKRGKTGCERTGQNGLGGRGSWQGLEELRLGTEALEGSTPNRVFPRTAAYTTSASGHARKIARRTERNFMRCEWRWPLMRIESAGAERDRREHEM